HLVSPECRKKESRGSLEMQDFPRLWTWIHGVDFAVLLDYNRETGIVKGGGRGYDGIHSLMKLHQRHSILKPNTETHKSWHNCCVHCVLACLFCEFLTLCNIVLGQASCGICTSEACCCCCGDEMGDDCNCPCDMDCGIMDACCESSDCLEICMECCGICFPS
ncbi:hypothetical protein FD755_012288, partial [Muntiacus reevesi]